MLQRRCLCSERWAKGYGTISCSNRGQQKCWLPLPLFCRGMGEKHILSPVPPEEAKRPKQNRGIRMRTKFRLSKKAHKNRVKATNATIISLIFVIVLLTFGGTILVVYNQIVGTVMVGYNLADGDDALCSNTSWDAFAYQAAVSRVPMDSYTVHNTTMTELSHDFTGGSYRNFVVTTNITMTEVLAGNSPSVYMMFDRSLLVPSGFNVANYFLWWVSPNTNVSQHDYINDDRDDIYLIKFENDCWLETSWTNNYYNSTISLLENTNSGTALHGYDIDYNIEQALAHFGTSDVELRIEVIPSKDLPIPSGELAFRMGLISTDYRGQYVISYHDGMTYMNAVLGLVLVLSSFYILMKAPDAQTEREIKIIRRKIQIVETHGYPAYQVQNEAVRQINERGGLF